MGSYFTYYPGDENLLVTVSGDITKIDEVVGINTFNTLFMGAFRALANPLAYASEIIGIGSLPNVLILEVTRKLMIF